MELNVDEVEYLRLLELCSRSLAKDYHTVHFAMKSLQNKLRIPSIIIGSFTGVAAFGTSKFPTNYQHHIPIVVGLINIAIAIFQTIESFLKIGENINLSATASSQFTILADDICKELALDSESRETSGAYYVRDCHTRYQQILSMAPMLSQFHQYLQEYRNAKTKNKGMIRQFIDMITPSNATPAGSASPAGRLSIEAQKSERLSMNLEDMTSNTMQKEAHFEKLRQMTFKRESNQSEQLTKRFTESKPRLNKLSNNPASSNAITSSSDEYIIELTSLEDK